MAMQESRDLPSTAADSRGPVILCGLGRVGRDILDLLCRLREPVVAITLAAGDAVPSGPARPGVEIHTGDASAASVLRRAGIERARALIAATGDDRTNVTIALHVRQIAPDLPMVVRIFDAELGRHLERALERMRSHSASALAAPVYVGRLQGEHVASAFELGGEHWLVEQSTVARDGPLAGRRVSEVGGDTRVVLARRRGGETLFDPGPDEVLAAEDELLTLVRRAHRPRTRTPLARRLANVARALGTFWSAPPRGLRLALYGLLAVILLSVLVFHVALGLSLVDAYYFVMTTLTTTGYGDINLQSARPAVKLYGTLVMVSGGALFAVLFSMMTDFLLRTRFSDLFSVGTSGRRGHVIVAGLGNVGYRIVNQLVALGEDVVAVERSAGAKFVGATRARAPVVLGDAAAPEILERAGLGGAKAVLAVTDNDLANLSIALLARQGACQVVARVFDSNLAERMRGVPAVGTVVSVTGAVAPTFVGSALEPDTVRGVVVWDQLLLFIQPAQVAPDGAAPAAAGPRTLLVENAAGVFRAAARPASPGQRTLAARFIPLGK
jgi:Trk K+ transport system NAD-binding subunit